MMDLSNLRSALAQAKQRRSKEEKRDYFASALEALAGRNISEELKQRIASECAIWHSEDAIQSRLEAYGRKVYSNRAEIRETVESIDSDVRAASHGFANLFGVTFAELPAFQQQTIISMCMKHLGYIPKSGTSMNASKCTYVAGQSQVGKTSVFLYLKSLPSFSYRMITSYRLSELASLHGDAVIEEYGRKGQTLVIDEIGWEDVAKHYGKDIDVVSHIIHARHSRGLDTHFTSNMHVSDLRYEHHIKMRITQTCNVITASNAMPFVK